ncbi:MAG TPA: MFS transporter [Chitinophagaceae bacterium]|nr:MFS transporter [Chitinophagaceae bacterium]
MEQQKTSIPTNYGALSTLVTVFFFWGFIAAGNSVFIPFCKHYFNLDQYQSQLIDFAFYGAYYLGALGLFIYTTLNGRDLVAKWGYKKSIVYGLVFSALGAIAMIVAVNGNTFGGMLIGFFIVALGFSLQQTAANPFALTLGDPATGSNRISLGGSINSFGTSIGPIVVALALFGVTKAKDDQINSLSLDKVTILYSVVCALFLGAAALFFFSKKVPSGGSDEKTESANKALIALIIMTILLVVAFVPVFLSYKENPVDEIAKKAVELSRMRWLLFGLVIVLVTIVVSYISANKKSDGWGAMKYPQLVLGMLAIFIYVGVEVAIGSNLSELLKQPQFGGFEAKDAAPYVSMYWGSLMIGRWAGAINVFRPEKTLKNVLLLIVPLLAFGVVILINTIAQSDMAPLYWYGICVVILVLAFYATQDRPARTLLVFSLLGMIAMMVGIFTEGQIATYAFLSGGLFCSVMWPCIFSLATAGLGKYTTQGSGFLIMMILGGGIIPPIQGKLADLLQSSHPEAVGFGIHTSYWIAVVCFAYLALFAYAVKGILIKQGIDYDEQSVAAH